MSYIVASNITKTISDTVAKILLVQAYALSWKLLFIFDVNVAPKSVKHNELRTFHFIYQT